MDTTRIREQLGRKPQHDAGDALLELLEGIRSGAGMDTPPLAPGSSGPLRVRVLITGLGRRGT